MRRAALWVCGRSGPAPYQRTASTGPGSGGEGGEDRFNRPGFEEHLRGGKDGSLSNRYAAVLAAHAGTIVCWDW